MAVYDRATKAVLLEEQNEVNIWLRHAMDVYDRATKAVLPEEQNEVNYLVKARDGRLRHCEPPRQFYPRNKMR